MPPTGSFGGWFGFSAFNGVFSSLSVIFINSGHTLKPGVPGLRGQFLRVTLVPCEVLVPPIMGPLRGWFRVFALLNIQDFKSKPTYFCKLFLYSQIGSTRDLHSQFLRVTLVPCEILVPPHGVVRVLFRVFSPLDALFSSPKSTNFTNNYHTLKPKVPSGLRG